MIWEGERDHYEPLPLYLDIIGAAVWLACIAGWVVILIGAAVAMGAVQ